MPINYILRKKCEFVNFMIENSKTKSPIFLFANNLQSPFFDFGLTAVKEISTFESELASDDASAKYRTRAIFDGTVNISAIDPQNCFCLKWWKKSDGKFMIIILPEKQKLFTLKELLELSNMLPEIISKSWNFCSIICEHFFKSAQKRSKEAKDL